MSTEFTRLNNSIITPIMKAKGFRKIGKYDYGATFDKALYKSSEKECQVLFSVHPYDYPFHGIRFEELLNGKKVLEKQYLFEDGDLELLINTLARDLKAGDIVI
jgi:hypothetical protein